MISSIRVAVVMACLQSKRTVTKTKCETQGRRWSRRAVGHRFSRQGRTDPHTEEAMSYSVSQVVLHGTEVHLRLAV